MPDAGDPMQKPCEPKVSDLSSKNLKNQGFKVSDFFLFSLTRSTHWCWPPCLLGRPLPPTAGRGVSRRLAPQLQPDSALFAFTQKICQPDQKISPERSFFYI